MINKNCFNYRLISYIRGNLKQIGENMAIWYNRNEKKTLYNTNAKLCNTNEKLCNTNDKLYNTNEKQYINKYKLKLHNKNEKT